MKNIYLFCLVSLYACQPGVSSKERNTPAQTDSLPVIPADTANQAPLPVTSAGEAIGISGDFNGDGVIDSAWRELVKRSSGPDEPDFFALKFNTTAIPGIDSIAGHFRIINEGDLNGDGLPEISLFQSPLHGTVHYMTTWTLTPAGWKSIAGPWLIPAAGEYQSDASLQNRIVLENDTVYFWQEDVNDDHFTLQKNVLPLEK
ncbi:hypothetical protein WJU16_10345 [Chitinophaga pollutisoli]|uniref:VCBS repeat-containing protein n=1 Tax=Chitinophaga pollutisoli TaxID=3133966 RepID=A0ABZ2YUK3_9BACT